MALCAINPSCKLWIHEKESTVKKIMKKNSNIWTFQFFNSYLYPEKSCLKKFFSVYVTFKINLHR